MGGHGWWSYIQHDDKKPKPEINRALLRRVFAYGRPYWKYVSIVLVCIAVTSLLDLLPPLIFRELIDHVLPEKNVGRLNLLALGLFGVPLINGIINVVQRNFSARAGEGIIFDLRTAMYNHLQRMGIRFFTDTKAGDIVSRFNSDVVGAQSAVTSTIPDIVTNVLTLISTFIVMLTIEWRLAVLAVAVFPLFWLPSRRVARILRDIRRRALEQNAQMSSAIAETLTINGALLVKTFGRQDQEADRFHDIARNVRDIGVERARVGQLFFLGMGIAGAIGTALIYWAGGHLVLSDAITAGTIVAFVAYLGRLYGPISSLSNVQVEFSSSMVSFERVFEYLDMPIEVQDKPGARELAAVQGRIEFEDVSFSYLAKEKDGERLPDDMPVEALRTGPNGDVADDPDAGEAPATSQQRLWALQDVNFTIEPGELVALVGPSGAGKTTITYLLPRLYDPTSGAIRLDGLDIREVTQMSLARQIGMVMQETYLFHDTILANLLYARPKATQAEVEAACRAANIHEFIASLPNGYLTVAGERGYRLSGGEKQRLAIARVVLKDPAILVLDEATSHLDSQSEALIQTALEPLMKGRTSIVIAHRLSTILAADKILVMNRGQVVEAGTHRQLLDMGGLYAELYETQFRLQAMMEA